MSRSYAVVGVLCLLFLIRALGGNDNTTTVADPDDWYATDPDKRCYERLAWICVCFTVCWFIFAYIWVSTHPPPPPPVDATASVDGLEPSPGMPNQFSGWGDFKQTDDGISLSSEESRVKNEVAVIRAELERLEREHQCLRDLLNQVRASGKGTSVS